jgi:hypothetical protein
MKLTSSSRGKDSKSSGNFELRRGVTRGGAFAAFLFGAALALAPLPAFAQHGGGGGGGGAHGGGGGGGFHGGGSGGGGVHASGGGSSSAHPASAATGASGGNAGTSTNHWWNPFHGNSATSSSNANGSAGSGQGSGDHATAEKFAAGNNTWQEPPAPSLRGASSARATNGATGIASSPRAAIASPPHVPVPRRPIGYGGYYPYYGGFGYGYGGLGFGGGLFYGAFGPCDPFWGCYGYGYGYGGSGIGYGYYGGSFSGGSDADLSYAGEDNSRPSQEPNPTLFAEAPDTSQQQEAAPGTATARPVTAVLYLKDGSSYAVSDYWLADGKVHYVTSYGGENAIDESELDLQKTVNENAAQGLTFTLRPASVVTRGAVVVPQ